MTDTRSLPKYACSVYRHVKDLGPCATIPLPDLLAAMRVDDGEQDGVAAVTAELRALEESDEEGRSACKARLLAPTPSAVFSGRRRMAGPWAHTGIVCVDVDGLDGLEAAEAARSRLRLSPSCAGGYVSPSGRGVKALWRIAHPPAPSGDTPDAYRQAAEEHRAAALTAMAMTRAALGADVDVSCQDVSRISYVSYDPGAWWRDDASELAWSPGLAPEVRDEPVARGLTAGAAYGGALPGDVKVGGVMVPMGMDPHTFSRIGRGGRHAGLLRAVKADAERGEDRREAWQEAAEAHMGRGRRNEIRDCIAWGWKAGSDRRREAEEEAQEQAKASAVSLRMSDYAGGEKHATHIDETAPEPEDGGQEVEVLTGGELTPHPVMKTLVEPDRDGVLVGMKLAQIGLARSKTQAGAIIWRELPDGDWKIMTRVDRGVIMQKIADVVDIELKRGDLTDRRPFHFRRAADEERALAWIANQTWIDDANSDGVYGAVREWAEGVSRPLEVILTEAITRARTGIKKADVNRDRRLQGEAADALWDANWDNNRVPDSSGPWRWIPPSHPRHRGRDGRRRKPRSAR